MDNSSLAIEIGSIIYQGLNILNLLFTTIGAIIVVYLFISKRNAISSIYNFLTNYTFQTSLNELYNKLDELNMYNSDEPKHRQAVINIFSEIIGQMRGNPIISKKCKLLLKKLSKIEEHPDLITDARKRSLMTESKETLRHINIESYHELLGEKHE